LQWRKRVQKSSPSSEWSDRWHAPSNERRPKSSEDIVAVTGGLH
jgi:hypothetical protein